MAKINLSNKPLAEAIFELRWELEEKQNNVKIDPFYKLLPGVLSDQIKDKYPFHEQLPAAEIPDAIASYIIQHRFREKEGGFPLIQVGPGIITVNETDEYDWDDFKVRISYTIDALENSYANPDGIAVKELVLRYINSINFNYEEENVLEFINKKLKVNVSLEDELFIANKVEQNPKGVDLKFVFPSQQPVGEVLLSLARGKKNDQDSLIWEILVKSTDIDKSIQKEELEKWVEEAHSLIESWFFKMIEGELETQFK